MYILSVWIVIVALIHSGLSVNSEDKDLNSLSLNYDEVEENAENVEVGLVQIDRLTISSIEQICKDSEKLIYIRQEDITIRCKDLINEENNQDLNRDKREADKVEGSGGDEVTTRETPEPTTPIDPQKITSEETTSAKTTLEETTPEATTESATVPEEVTTKRTNKFLEIAAVTVEGAKIMEIIPEESIEEPKIDEKQPEVTKEEPKDENSDKDPKEDVEKIKGRTLIDGPEKEETKEQSHDEHDESVQESTAAKKAGSKDTTILIVLFVAVVVVGVLAFGYNFIKKKRQQSADLERVERNSIKRSLQNLTKPEGGEAEKKPLIGESKEVEMVDMKKGEESKKEPNENGEPVVKS